MAQQALWSGRFEGKMDDDTLQFTSSLDIDVMLAFYDVMGSLAHVRMLKACHVIPDGDADKIIEGLKTIAGQMQDDSFEIDESLEDIHTNIEFRLTDLIGPAGGKLHTGRSRNDQVVTDFRMYMRDAVLEIVSSIDSLMDALIKIAQDHGATIMPGFTHMQHAQPVTLAQHALAHAFKLSRDADRFLDAYDRMNKCPLGAAALAGTTYHIDREMTSKALGFDAPTENSMDSVSDRDFASECAFDASLCAVHLSSMAEEIVLWSSQEFGFIELDDKYSTGSSIMPQKKNPDIAELIRGKTGMVTGSLVSMLMMTKGLPLSYNRDLQEDKAPVMMSLEAVHNCLQMMTKIVSTMRVRKDHMLAEVSAGCINATDLADYLVTKGVPFREAHGIVGKAVRTCIASNKRLDDLTIDEFRQYSPLIDKDVYKAISIESCVERRNSQGGTSSTSTDAQMLEAIRQAADHEEKVRLETGIIEKCWDELLQ